MCLGDQAFLHGFKSFFTSCSLMRSVCPTNDDSAFYQKNSPLLAVVTGMERSGTTLLSQLLNAHPRIKSGVECGVLLSNIHDFGKVKPFYDWMLASNDKHHWGWSITLSDRRRLLTAHSYDEFYWLLNLFKGSAHCNAEIQKKFKQADLIFDKTPRYVYSLSKIMAKTPYKFLITLKTPSEQYLSALKYSRTGIVDLVQFRKNYLLAYDQINQSFMAYPDRVLVIPYKKLVEEMATVMKQVKSFLALDDKCILDLEHYNCELGSLFGTNISNRAGNSFTSDRIYYQNPSTVLSSHQLEQLENAFGGLNLDFV